ncbi:4'-phosphopantetheinyl transferase superfamily protein [Bradyrhizobium rifense]|uniref:4'-phosphopantetheinyl transferase superfamily protein n=1 Tax=Bradyrhizobium rifense TaxID=515499 RepID=A0A5D3KFH8_9BRAD|nr:4'-phosphopantetheinyl transferase superfamily protein [Bradyrhizobium rifense]TYL92024.1 4'-phosphopantetheinyl transferase superfamily protein [Bradyrhizobium rifense]
MPLHPPENSESFLEAGTNTLQSPLEQWQLGLPARPACGEIHVWRLRFSSPKLAELGWQFMTNDERARAELFRFAPDRERFCQSRFLLRQVLGGYLKQDPAKVPVMPGAHGKPELDSAISSHGLQFNLTHSHSVALLAITTGQTVGIDAEDIARFGNPDVAGLADSLLSKREIEVFMSLDQKSRIISFLRCWTRKEALLKAVGIGLLAKLDDFEVPMDDRKIWSVQWPPDHRPDASTFQMADLSGLGYSAAVAAPMISGPVQLFELHHPELATRYGNEAPPL